MKRSKGGCFQCSLCHSLFVVAANVTAMARLEEHRVTPPIRRRPDEWEKLTGIKVLDRDGWRDGSWNKPITEEEWNERQRQSTVRHAKLRRK